MTNQSVVPTVGMGATYCAGSDRYPYTVHHVDGKKMWISADEYTRTDTNGPYTELQEYTYSNANQDNPGMKWNLCTLRKDGKWHFGTTMAGAVLHVGIRRAYIDPHF